MEDGLPDNLISWLADLRAEYERARESSKALLERTERLGEMSEDLAAAMNMRFLYDADRGLFAIGYQAGGPLNFSAHYDLLASEARLSSLVAIAKDDVPVHHWLALGRPYTSSDGQVLLSWSGTMFEYLMPLLFTRSFRNSLLEMPAPQRSIARWNTHETGACPGEFPNVPIARSMLTRSISIERLVFRRWA